MRISERLTKEINKQIGREFEAHQQYIAIAAHFEKEALPQLASFFYRQAQDEHNHAMIFLQYLLDQDAAIEFPPGGVATFTFSTLEEAIECGLQRERNTSERIYGLMAIAKEEHDYASEEILQWFVKEQVEEENTFSDLLAVAQRNVDNPDEVEHFVRREFGSLLDDHTTPPIAGA